MERTAVRLFGTLVLTLAFVGCAREKAARRIIVEDLAADRIIRTAPPPTDQAKAFLSSSESLLVPLDLEQKLDGILNRLSNTGAIYAARVVDPYTGRELYAHDIDRPMIPASNMKLPVTAAAADFYAADHEFLTPAYLVGKDLVIVGCGDPGLGDKSIHDKRGESIYADIDRWIAQLRSLRVRRLDHLVLVDAALDAQRVHPTWDSDDLVYWYAAPVASINYNDNCIDVTATPGIVTQEPTLDVTPAVSDSIEIVNNATTIVGGPEQTVEFMRDVDRNRFVVSGNINRKTTFPSRPVIDPVAFFGDVVKTRFLNEGILIKQVKVTRDMPRVPASAVKLTPAATSLFEIMPRINKNSQNLFAEALSKMLGRDAQHSMNAVGTWPSAETAIRTFFAKHNIDAAGFNLADGSGLSRANRITIRQISGILMAMRNHPNAAVFFDSLSVGGVDGTVASRFRDQPQRVFAKTGYIGGVRSFSGYCQTDSGKWVIFSIIFNQIPGPVRPYQDLQDEAVALLMREIK